MNPKKQISAPANRCIFLEPSTADLHVGISKEHLWPQWLGGAFPQVEKQSNHAHSYIRFSNLDSQTVVVQPDLSFHRGAHTDRKLRVVCPDCNNGWMSRIEDAAKDILGDIINGRKRSITLEQQESIALWAVLKSIIGEYTDIETKVIPEADALYLAKEKNIPDNWKIWVGNFLGGDPQWNRRYSHTGIRINTRQSQDDNSVGNLQSTLFVIGELFLYAVCMPPEFLDGWSPGKDLVQIWPSAGAVLDWPPTSAIGDARAEEIRALLQNLAISLMR